MAINDGLIYELNDKGENILVKSLESRQRAYLRFTNRSSRPVNVWWRDFNGKRQHYVRLETGSHFDLNSFLTHPWEFTDIATNENFVINNKLIFRAPTNVGNMRYRTNWNITVRVRSLRRNTMLVLASLLPSPEAVQELDLPAVLTQELSELVNLLRNPPVIENNQA